MEVNPERNISQNDDDSVIYVSDDSNAAATFGSEVELRNDSIEAIYLDSSMDEDDIIDENNNPDVILQETTQAITKEYVDKATQTDGKRFPTRFYTSNDTSAPINSSDTVMTHPKNATAVNSGPNQSTSTASGSVPAATSFKIKNPYNQGNKKNHRKFTNAKNSIHNKTTRTYKRKKNHRKHRKQPYKRYNKYNSNYNQSNCYGYGYNNNNGRYNNYNSTYRDNYDNYWYEDLYDPQNYCSPNFIVEFKERLLQAFIYLLSYVFDYNYSREAQFF